MQRIVVVNPKGGSGKTTIATNLAGYLASRRQQPVLMDFDPQGSSTRWARKRHPTQGKVHLIAAHERDARVTLSFQLHPPSGTTHVVVDTPAAIPAQEMPKLTRTADKILVPVLPSDIDIHACSRCIRDLLLVAKVPRDQNRLGVIANRVRRNTLVYHSLMRFLESLGIPIVATIRDSQNYVRAAETGYGIHEMAGGLVREDLEAWEPLVQWLAQPAGAPPAAATGATSTAETAAATTAAPTSSAAATAADVGTRETEGAAAAATAAAEALMG
ncbi:MAG TPA: AAA family ATPase [Steroidobacteraceae bacterium]|nr:AAA family ATPase [Steroidobacteraceae bacterium]